MNNHWLVPDKILIFGVNRKSKMAATIQQN